MPDLMDLLFWFSMAGIAGSIWLAAVVMWLLSIAASEWLTKWFLERTTK